jgi:hypothetical protein
LQQGESVGQVLGSTVDVVHALLMAAWVVGLPLLFLRRWPRTTRIYGVYAISFIVMSQVSQITLGECFLTTISRGLWESSPGAARGSDEWFTVRLAKWVFDKTPSHRAIVLLSEFLILLTATGALMAARVSVVAMRLVGRRKRGSYG